MRIKCKLKNTRKYTIYANMRVSYIKSRRLYITRNWHSREFIRFTKCRYIASIELSCFRGADLFDRIPRDYSFRCTLQRYVVVARSSTLPGTCKDLPSNSDVFGCDVRPNAICIRYSWKKTPNRCYLMHNTSVANFAQINQPDILTKPWFLGFAADQHIYIYLKELQKRLTCDIWEKILTNYSVRKREIKRKKQDYSHYNVTLQI